MARVFTSRYHRSGARFDLVRRCAVDRVGNDSVLRDLVRMIFEQERVVVVERRSATDKLRYSFLEIEAHLKKATLEKINKSQKREYRKNITALARLAWESSKKSEYITVPVCWKRNFLRSMHIAFGHDYEGNIKVLNHQSCVTRRSPALRELVDGRLV